MSLKEIYLDIISHGANITRLCDTLADALGTPVAVTLPTRTITAHSYNYTDSLILEYSQSTRMYTRAELKHNAEHFEKQLMTRKPFSGIYPYTLHKRINCGCFWHGNLISVLDIPLVEVTETEEMFSLVEEAALVFTSALILNHGLPTGDVDPMETYMIGLLCGQVLPENQQIFNYSIRFNEISSWRAVWIQPFNPADLRDLSLKCYSFCSRQKSIWCTNWTNGVAILLDDSELGAVIRFQEGWDSARFVVSDAFSHLSNFPKELAQLRDTFSIADHINDKRSLLFANKYKYPYLFLTNAQKGDLHRFESPLLNIIRTNSTTTSDLEMTVRSYVLNNMNISQVAQELHVHKNTVSYRLQKFTELTGANLNDCGVIAELYLAVFLDILQ